jgi:hypothetical protein
MKSRLKGIDLYLMKVMSYGLLFGEKQTNYFQKSITSWRKKKLKFSKNVLINELYKGKNFNWKKLLKINALLLPKYKSHLKAKNIYKENGPKMDFQICNFLLLFGPCYHAFTLGT